MPSYTTSVTVVDGSPTTTVTLGVSTAELAGVVGQLSGRFIGQAAPAGTPAGYVLTVQGDGTYAAAAIPGAGGSAVGAADL